MTGQLCAESIRASRWGAFLHQWRRPAAQPRGSLFGQIVVALGLPFCRS
ncbi:hypothetical protein [Micromonospora chersina]